MSDTVVQLQDYKNSDLPASQKRGGKQSSGYAGKVVIRHGADAARAAGIEIGAIDIWPDGRIRLTGTNSLKPLDDTPESEFDRFQREGRL
jgi:hypothetical protein